MTIISDHSNEGGEIENILKLSDKDLKARKVEVCNPRFKTFVNRNVHCYSLWTSHLIRWRRSITNRRKTQPNGSQKRRKGVPLRRIGRYSYANKEGFLGSHHHYAEITGSHYVLLQVCDYWIPLHRYLYPHSKGGDPTSNLFLPFRISKKGWSVYGQDVEKSDVHVLAASCLHDGW